MKVSVIICTYSMDRLQDTIEAIDSIFLQTYPDIEIIASIDHSQEVLSALKKVYSDRISYAINNDIVGLSDTRNAGIKKASGDIIAFIDDDAVADKKWIETLVVNYSDPSVVAVGGKLIPVWNDNRPWWFPEELDWIVGCTYKGHPQGKTEVRNLIGCNMSFCSKVFKQVGYFSTNIGRLKKIPLAGEEMEYCIRIGSNMPKNDIIYDPDAIVYHKVDKYRGRLKYLLKRSFAEGISKRIIKNNLEVQNLLYTENNYIKFLLFNSIKSYLLMVVLIREPIKNLMKLLAIFLSVLTVACGYIKK